MKTDEDEAEGEQQASTSHKGQILEEGNQAYLGYAIAEAAAVSPGSFVGAVGHDLGSKLVGLTARPCLPGPHTAADQFQAEHDCIGKSQAGEEVLLKAPVQEGPPSKSSQQTDASLSLSKPESASSGGLSSSRLFKRRKASSVQNLAGHYDAHDDVVLQFEAFTPQQTRFIFAFLWCSLFVALGLLLWTTIDKVEANPAKARRLYQKEDYVRAVGGSICLILIAGCIVAHAARFLQAKQRQKVWKRRRVYLTVAVFVESCLQLVVCLTLLIPNFAGSQDPCAISVTHSHGTGASWILRWTCFNTIFLIGVIMAHNTNIIPEESAIKEKLPETSSEIKALTHMYRDTRIICDLPLTFHLPKLALWAALEGVIIASYVVIRHQDDGLLPTAAAQGVDIISRSTCVVVSRDTCQVSNTTLVLITVSLAITLTYFLLLSHFLLRMLRQLRTLTYQAHKINNLLVRLQLRTRVPAFTFFLVGAAVIWYVKPHSCGSYMQTWMGLLPINVALTASTVAMTFIALPVDIRKSALVLNVWLQEFVWLEKDLEASTKNRNIKVPREQGLELQQEPMFCVETSVVALYWSLLVYDYQEVRSSQLCLDEGCMMFQPPLLHTELIWDRVSDTKLLMAWNKDVLVLAFRGTASFTNVFADLQAWQTVHLPRRGRFWRRPKVHRGFQQSYLANGFKANMLAKIRSIAAEGEVKLKDMRLLVTGHSLGGALATLAAYDIAHMLSSEGSNPKPQVYTFGAPRTGNHAFAADFQASVPDCWHIINDQDVVAQRSKFISLYKLGGHRVIINMKGDIIVRPAAIEASAMKVPCSGSVTQHLLTAYLNSMLMVILAQFCSKSLIGGAIGGFCILQSHPPWRRWLVQKTGLTVGDLVALQGITSRQSAEVDSHTSRLTLESIAANSSLDSPHESQGRDGEADGDGWDDLRFDGEPQPAALNRKVDRFIRQGLSQAHADALHLGRLGGGTSGIANTRGSFGCEGQNCGCMGNLADCSGGCDGQGDEESCLLAPCSSLCGSSFSRNV